MNFKILSVTFTDRQIEAKHIARHIFTSAKSQHDSTVKPAVSQELLRLEKSLEIGSLFNCIIITEQNKTKTFGEKQPER